MADSNTYPILSVCATVESRLPDLTVKDGQLIFVRDKHKVALDYNGKRVFYNQIRELATDAARTSILAPVSGFYYFVIDTAVLWTYQNGWVQITTPPEDIIFIGVTMPELGKNKTLYVDTAKKEISVWDSETSSYVVVANNSDGGVTEERVVELIESYVNEAILGGAW